MGKRFSIIVVSLNPGNKLKETINSIISQNYKDYEIIIKDGMSQDGSLDALSFDSDISVKIVKKQDLGIYDAMNQAVEEAEGDYVYFLNCGDFFADENVLTNVAKNIDKILQTDNSGIVYGNIYDRLTQNIIYSNPKIDGFGCYRNVPCHQACFYKRELVNKHPFDIKYRVRADYEQFLWCFYDEKITPAYMDVLVADYEGGGYSETKEHLKLSAVEHKIITKKYMKTQEIIKYRFILFITLSKLRTYIAHNKKTAVIYNKLKKIIYTSRR